MDKVHEMMDDIGEQQALSDEIIDAISHPLGFGLDVDDADLENELDALQQENFDNEMLSISKPTPTLPEPPVEDLPKKAKEKKAAAVADDSEW